MLYILFSFTEVFRILHFLLVHFILYKIICLIIVIIFVSIWCYYTIDNNFMIMNYKLNRCSWRYTVIISVILYLLFKFTWIWCRRSKKRNTCSFVGCNMPDLSSGILTVPVFGWRLFPPSCTDSAQTPSDLACSADAMRWSEITKSLNIS